MNSANRLHSLKREKRGKGNVDSLNTQVFLGEKSYFLNGTKRIRDSFKGMLILMEIKSLKLAYV